ncbi:hypothetical protein BJ983_005254 [Actinomycetospora corticicola]|uniref:Uncharacterized protein n=1 Tax=Actinomycetospora corticicola TaxID=663602 RepID=A0A7Y9E1F6_9PSEU|nr:hypothetical protein [Actinomycetospora corticicola]
MNPPPRPCSWAWMSAWDRVSQLTSNTPASPRRTQASTPPRPVGALCGKCPARCTPGSPRARRTCPTSLSRGEKDLSAAAATPSRRRRDPRHAR